MIRIKTVFFGVLRDVDNHDLPVLRGLLSSKVRGRDQTTSRMKQTIKGVIGENQALDDTSPEENMNWGSW